MEFTYTVTNIAEALAERRHPAITRWNRLEGRPRTHNFGGALKAEVRDALWMLTKQWQMGEFRGDDAASPVLARLCVDTSRIDRFQAAQGRAQALDPDQPLEARVECRPLPLQAETQYLSLDMRMIVGRRWLKLLAREEADGRLANDYGSAYVLAYPIAAPDPTDPADAPVCAHAQAWQMASTVAERVMDGIAFLEYLRVATHSAADGVAAAAGDEAPLAALAVILRKWFAALIMQPSAQSGDAWLPSRLEYQFACSAPTAAGENVMRADEYYTGSLDWYSLERRPEESQLAEPPAPPQPPVRSVHTFLPAAIVFEGMPDTRWWAFEDRRTNFGQVRPDTTDLGKLLLMEFALVYANNWFVLPYTLPIGSVTEVQGMALTNVFGERLWIEPARTQPAASWQRWSMFTLTTPSAQQQAVPAQLVLLPTAPKVLESAALEEVAFLRDEMANMVWGIERRIILPSGDTKRGAEAGRELLEFLQRPLRQKINSLQARKAELEAIAEAQRTHAQQDELDAVIADLADIAPPDSKAPIRYHAMSTVPENWIPFIPVHVGASTRETQLQRAAMPRILDGAPNAQPPEKVRPRTSLLHQGLPGTYFVFEEEVPRAGAVVSHSYQRTRWTGGQVFTWFGARKQTGRGEGSSGLAFDQAKPMSGNPPSP